jgi:hypothetical protein
LDNDNYVNKSANNIWFKHGVLLMNPNGVEDDEKLLSVFPIKSSKLESPFARLS